MDAKQEFVLKSLDGRIVFTELCREYSISTKTGYKWRERFLLEGMAGLEEKSRRPLSNSKAIPEAMSVELLRIKKLHEAWGAAKILAVYKRNNPGKQGAARSSVERLFKRAGYKGARRRRNLGEQHRIQARLVPEGPNDLWTVDFKGWWYTKDKEKVNPLTVRDEYSKKILAIQVAEKGDIPAVKAVFIRLFKEYGLPAYLRSDNGPPFGNMNNLWGLTKLSVWWMALGIKIDRDDPGHPEQNGAHERMHKDMMTELEGQIDGNLNEHQKVFDAWRIEFNSVRPHEALGMKVPDDVYVKSSRKYGGENPAQRYGKGFKVRQTNSRGYINLDGKRIFVGNPFAGYQIGIKQYVDKNPEVWFNDFMLGTINPASGLVEPCGNRIQAP